eukprot:3337448-Pleurochrysis_carterae.AAC.3
MPGKTSAGTPLEGLHARSNMAILCCLATCHMLVFMAKSALCAAHPFSYAERLGPRPRLEGTPQRSDPCFVCFRAVSKAAVIQSHTRLAGELRAAPAACYIQYTPI